MSVDEEHLQKVMRTFSHDISSALRAAIGFSKLISQQYEEQLDDKALGWLALVQREGEEAQEQLKAFSRYARLYAIEEVQGQCSLHHLCEQAVSQLAHQYSGFQVDIGPLPVIQGHNSLWLMFFQEVLGNCARYASEASCRVYVDRQNEYCYLVVEDDGGGIDERGLKSALQPFKTIRDDGHGVGIGLSIAKRVVDIHGGQLEIKSLPHGVQGCRVLARLPSSAL